MEKPREKDWAAVSLGRKGGKKGGPARAANMTPEARREQARAAANARWSKNKAENYHPKADIRGYVSQTKKNLSPKRAAQQAVDKALRLTKRSLKLTENA
jgi:hypothetical protein